MTVQHHPADDLLVSYAAGSLGESWSLAIAAHLAFCPRCRQSANYAEEIGGVLLDEVEPASVAPNALDQVFASIYTPVGDDKIDRLEVEEKEEAISCLPLSIQHYVGNDIENIPWQRLGNDGFQYLIETNDQNVQARLLRIKADRPVPSHGHNGRELTLVLAGNFEDEISRFGVGDLQDVGESTVHKPVAGVNEDCICLAVTDAPLRFNELLPRLLQPLYKI